MNIPERVVPVYLSYAYLDTQQAVDKWGCKKVKVYILKEQNDKRWKETDYIKND